MIVRARDAPLLGLLSPPAKWPLHSAFFRSPNQVTQATTGARASLRPRSIGEVSRSHWSSRETAPFSPKEHSERPGRPCRCTWKAVARTVRAATSTSFESACEKEPFTSKPFVNRRSLEALSRGGTRAGGRPQQDPVRSSIVAASRLLVLLLARKIAAVDLALGSPPLARPPRIQTSSVRDAGLAAKSCHRRRLEPLRLSADQIRGTSNRPRSLVRVARQVKPDSGDGEPASRIAAWWGTIRVIRIPGRVTFVESFGDL